MIGQLTRAPANTPSFPKMKKRYLLSRFKLRLGRKIATSRFYISGCIEAAAVVACLPRQRAVISKDIEVSALSASKLDLRINAVDAALRAERVMMDTFRRQAGAVSNGRIVNRL
jgi:hypothetical protein